MNKVVQIESEAIVLKDVFKVGGIAFLFSSIIPIIISIRFFIVFFPIDYTLNGYGDWQFGIELGWVICTWLMCIIPVTIPAMIGKYLLFTEKKNNVYFAVLAAFILALLVYFIGSAIILRLG